MTAIEGFREKNASFSEGSKIKENLVCGNWVSLGKESVIIKTVGEIAQWWY